MKKIKLILLMSTLAFAFTVTGLANTNPTVITGSGPHSAQTVITYTVPTKYEITIPPAIRISEGTGSGAYGVKAGSLIGAGETLTFTITGAANYGGTPARFRLRNESGSDVYLDYNIANGITPVAKGDAFITASPDDCYGGKLVTLTYTTGAAEAAGAYKDIVTITVNAE